MSELLLSAQLSKFLALPAHCIKMILEPIFSQNWWLQNIFKKNFLEIFIRECKKTKAVFLVVCDPSMNKLWGT